MAKKIAIVGGGIAGLSTGCYARMNGFETSIFEMHSIPGGLCTAWKRKGYTFDISMHMLSGSRSGPFYRMWQELGVVQGRTFHYHDALSRIEGRQKQLTLSGDPRRLAADLFAASPADARLTKEFVRLIGGRGMSGAFSLKPAELMGLGDGIRTLIAILPHARTLLRYGRTTVQDFAARFQDPFLRDAVRFIIDTPGWPMHRFPMVGLAGLLHEVLGEAGVPLGGSQAAVFRIADRYRELGGELVCRRRVTDVVIERDRAVGVRLDDGTEQRADEVVWAADAHTVIFDILGGRYLDDTIRRAYAEWKPVVPLVHVMLGVARDLSKEPARLIYELETPIEVGGRPRRWMCVSHRCFDPGMAPPGKSAVEVWYDTEYAYWEALARDRARYDAEKQRIAEVTIAELDRRWPGFKEQVEVVDVPTPATYVRYTGNWQGSPDGWYITPENMRTGTMLRSLPGLAGFRMVGQWTTPFAGTVMSALSGRQAIELMCRRAGGRFVTNLP